MCVYLENEKCFYCVNIQCKIHGIEIYLVIKKHWKKLISLVYSVIFKSRVTPQRYGVQNVVFYNWILTEKLSLKTSTSVVDKKTRTFNKTPDKKNTYGNKCVARNLDYIFFNKMNVLEAFAVALNQFYLTFWSDQHKSKRYTAIIIFLNI